MATSKYSPFFFLDLIVLTLFPLAKLENSTSTCSHGGLNVALDYVLALKNSYLKNIYYSAKNFISRYARLNLLS